MYSASFTASLLSAPEGARRFEEATTACQEESGRYRDQSLPAALVLGDDKVGGGLPATVKNTVGSYAAAAPCSADTPERRRCCTAIMQALCLDVTHGAW